MILKKLIPGLLIVLTIQGVSMPREQATLPALSPSIAKKSGRTLWWVYRDGREEAVNAPPALYYFPDLSPDGTKLVFTVQVHNNRDIWILDLVKNALYPFATNEGSDNQPVWSPSGQGIAFSSSAMRPEMLARGAIAGIVWKSLNTGEEVFLEAFHDKWMFPFSWHKDGKMLLVGQSGTDYKNFDIGVISADRNRPFTLLLNERYQELQPQLSPDGRWLAYSSKEARKMQVYVCPFPDVNAGNKWQISTMGGNSPRWSRDGKELYYLTGEKTANTLLVVDVGAGETFTHSEPRILIKGKYLGPLPNNGIPYVVHPDGQRFLMMKP